MPYEASGCDVGQAPNGNLPADGAVSTFSHELAEAITDPLDSGTSYAWSDGKGNEIGDMCAENFGGALGSTNASHRSGTEYNQVINGHRYYVQELFSNLAFAKSGVGKGLRLERGVGREPQGGRHRGWGYNHR